MSRAFHLLRRALAPLALGLALMTAAPDAHAQALTGGPSVSATRLALAPARPNPFANATRLVLTLEQSERIIAAVYDALGRRVATLYEGELEAGTHTLTLQAGTLRGGLYLVRVTGERGRTATRPVVLSR